MNRLKSLLFGLGHGAMFFLLMTSFMACQPTLPDIGNDEPADPANDTEESVIDEDDPEPGVTVELLPTLTQPNNPTPEITAIPKRATPQNWQIFIEQNTGLILSSPPKWVNVGALASTESLAEALGQDNVLLVADQLETGIQVLTGRPVDNGAFAIALIGNDNLPDILTVPEDVTSEIAISRLLQSLELNRPISTVFGNGISGAFAQFDGDPTGVISTEEQGVVYQIALFIDDSVTPAVPIYLIMGAGAGVSAEFRPVFETLMTTLGRQQSSDAVADGIGFLDASMLNGGVDSAAGSIAPNETTYWAFEGRQGNFATITVTPDTETSDIAFTLQAPSGRLLVAQDSGYAGDQELLADFSLPEDGIYIVQVREFFGEPDRYTINLNLSETQLFGNGGLIEYDQQLQGDLSEIRDNTWFFDGQAGDAINIIVEPLADFDPSFSLIGPDGVTITDLDEGFSGDSEVLGNLTLELTGEYRIVVKNFSEIGGVYTIALDRAGQAAVNFHEAGDLTFGTTLQERMLEGEIHVWFLPGRTGDNISIKANPLASNIDLDVWLLDPDTNRLVMQDEGLGGEAETIRYTLPRDGEYVVLVQEFFGTSGEYEISANVSSNNFLVPAGEIELEQELDGQLPAGRGALWQFDAVQGEFVTIRVTPLSPEVDFSLALRDPNNQPILQTDKNRAGEIEQLFQIPITQTGTWFIIVQSFFENEGAYTLSVKKAAAPPTDTPPPVPTEEPSAYPYPGEEVPGEVGTPEAEGTLPPEGGETPPAEGTEPPPEETDGGG